MGQPDQAPPGSEIPTGDVDDVEIPGDDQGASPSDGAELDEQGSQTLKVQGDIGTDRNHNQNHVTDMTLEVSYNDDEGNPGGEKR